MQLLVSSPSLSYAPRIECVPECDVLLGCVAFDAAVWASDFFFFLTFCCLTVYIGWFPSRSLFGSSFGRLPSLVTASHCGVDPDIFSHV